MTLPLASAASAVWWLAAVGWASPVQVIEGSTLRADIELTPEAPTPSSVEFLARSADRVLFKAQALTEVPGLWLTSPGGAAAIPLALTASGEELLVPAVFPSPAVPAAAFGNGNFVFSASTDSTGNEVFVVDVVSGVSTLLVDLRPGAASSNPDQFTAWGGRVWFLANDGAGADLYSTDGTAAGTRLEQSLQPSSVKNLYASEGPLYLSSYGITATIEPTDGLYALTNPSGPLDLLVNGKFGPSPSLALGAAATSIGSRLFFTLDDGTAGAEPWVTDGTPGGTRLLADVEPGPDGSVPEFLAASGGTAMFAATSVAQGLGREYYLTDGTASGTGLLVDIGPGIGGGALEQAVGYPGGFVFLGSDQNGPAVWSSTTALGSAQRLFGPFVGPPVAPPSAIAAGDLLTSGSLVYFTADDGASGYELYVTDGTPSGTGPAVDLLPGANGSNLRLHADMPWGLFGSGDSGQGVEPHRTDGSLAGTVQIQNLTPDETNGSSDPADWLAFRDQVVFGAATQATGRELFGLRQGEADAELLADLEAGPDSSGAAPVIALADRFITRSNVTSFSLGELWGSTGEPGSEELLATILGSGLPAAVEFAGRALLPVRDGGGSAQSLLLATDGTSAGTEVLVDGLPEISASIAAFGGLAWFCADAGGTGRELWSSDGTASGTQLAFSLNPGPQSGAFWVESVGSWLAVGGSSPLTGDALFALSDQGNLSTLDEPIAPGPASAAEILERTVLGDRLIFAGSPQFQGNQRQVYAADGTASGTVALTQFPPSAELAGSSIDGFVTAGDVAYFWYRSTFDADAELWVTDGTPGGTLAVAQAVSATPLDAGVPVGSSNRALFLLRQADEPNPRVFLARPEPGGLELAAELESGSLPGFRLGARLGEDLLVNGREAGVGFEVHGLSIVELGGYVAEPYGKSCGDAHIGASGEARVGSTLAVELQAAPAAAAGLFVSFEQQFGEVLAPGCRAWIGPSALVASAIADAAGEVSVPFQIPALPSLAGVGFYAQWSVLASGGPLLGLLELSEGLEVILGM